MEKYLKMSDLFEGGVTANHGDEYNGWSVVETSCGLSIDESGDGGFEAMTADYVAHAINSHDELVAMNKELLAALEVIAASEEFHGGSFVCDFETLQGVAREAIAKAKGTA